MDPRCYAEIKFTKHAPEWLKSYWEEITSFEKIADCKIIPRSEVPDGCQILPLLEIFKTKMDGRKKSRFCVRGDLEEDPPSDLYSPTASQAAVKILIALAASHGWKLHQLDVKNAYLNGRTKEPTYIELPQGHPKRDKKKTFVYKTYAAVYGLKASPKIWNQCLNDVLENYGLKACPIERCIYAGKGVNVLVYVDDLLYCGESEQAIHKFEEEMQKHFVLSIEDKVSKFLGIQIEERETGTLIHQTEYCKKLISSFGMENANALNIPILPNLKLDDINQAPLESAHLFQAILGSLLFLNLGTRPDLCFSVNYLSRRSKAPTAADLKALKAILRYLKGNYNYGIFYPRGASKVLEINAIVDSSFATGPRRKSVTGMLIQVNGGCVFFRTKVQGIQAESTTEAEYEAIQAAGRELLYVRNVLRFFGQQVRQYTGQKTHALTIS